MERGIRTFNVRGAAGGVFAWSSICIEIGGLADAFAVGETAAARKRKRLADARLLMFIMIGQLCMVSQSLLT